MKEIHPIYTQLGERIKQLRLVRGLSQEALAFEAGLDRTYVGHIERGMKRASLEVLLKISAVLQVSLFELFQFNQKSLGETGHENLLV